MEDLINEFINNNIEFNIYGCSDGSEYDVNEIVEDLDQFKDNLKKLILEASDMLGKIKGES
jgi:hypothetical protein